MSLKLRFLSLCLVSLATAAALTPQMWGQIDQACFNNCFTPSFNQRCLPICQNPKTQNQCNSCTTQLVTQCDFQCAH